MKQETETESISLQSRKRWLVLGSVLTSRIVYTINWFDTSPALLLIAADFGLRYSSLGILTSSFLLGAGIFQIPAGIMSAKWGAKNTSQLGMLILSLSGISEGLSPNFPILTIAKFTLGIGAALFFAPAIGILVPLFREEEEGLVIGLYNSCFNIGGGIALFGWVIVIEVLGWRGGLVLGGLIGLVSVLLGQIIIPRDIGSKIQRPPMRPAFMNRNIWVIAFGVMGLWGGVFTASSLLQTFLPSSQELNCSLSNTSCLQFAGVLASSIMFASIAGGPIGGYLSDHFHNRKFFILFPGLGASVGILLFGFSSPIGLVFLIPMVGFLDAMVFSTMYASPRLYQDIGKYYAPLGISIINSVQILFSFSIPIIFAYLVDAYGGNYSPGWFFIGTFAIVMMLLVLFLKEPFKSGSKNSS